MPLLSQPFMQPVDIAGVPLAFAEAYFYLEDTTDPVDVFADAGLTVPRTWPVVADDQGIFPSIFFDGNQLIRMKLIVAGGDLATPLFDISPVNTLFEVFASNLADNAIQEKLGYNPVDPANAVFTAPARLNFVATELNIDDVGLRGTPPVIKNVDYTVDLEASGGLLIKDDATTPTWTIPPNKFPLGHWFDIYIDNDTGSVTLTRGVGVTLLGADDATNEDKVIPPLYKGRCTQVASDQWVLDPDPAPPADLSANGYFKLPNGYIRQWGTYTGNLNGDSTRAVAFPIPFPNTCLGASVTALQNGVSTTADMSANVKAAPITTGFDVYVSGQSGEVINGFIWEAWGR